MSSRDHLPVLEATALSRTFRIRRTGAQVQALRAVDLTVPAGSAIGLVGESGSGKSSFARIVAGLLRPTGGHLSLMGTDVTHLSGWRRRRLGLPVQMIFQNPRGSLNPRLPIARSIAEPAQARGDQLGRRDLVQLMDQVGLPADHLDRYPHELSGGQCQRVAIARAIAARPELIIADEPVSALDASVQAQILNLFKDIQQQSGTAVLFISHDLGAVRFLCDRVNVLYVGQVVEEGDAESVFRHPAHPYTRALASAVPSISTTSRPQRIVLAGEPPRPESPPPGCTFHTRCPQRIGVVCDQHVPTPQPSGTGIARCHLLAETPPDKETL